MKIRPLKQKGFEEILIAQEEKAGLHAVIAIHDTRLGPALGGIRMFPYRSEAEAVQDATRLAEAMTFKAASAELALGGGKAVIIGDPNRGKSPALLEAMGHFVEKLAGRYISAKDSGITTQDLVQISKITRHVTGLPESMGGSGDPSPWTSLGVLEGIKLSVREKLGKENLKGLRIAIQGVGHVGGFLAELLAQEKTELWISDINSQQAHQAAGRYGAKESSPGEIYELPADIFSPCAMGGVINDETVPKLRCSIVAGGANNQLLDEARHGKALLESGILYVPDYVLNAGGLINIYVKDILKEKDSRPWILKIAPRLKKIFDLARKQNIPTSQAARQWVYERMAFKADFKSG